jgi:hypothetical protein
MDCFTCSSLHSQCGRSLCLVFREVQEVFAVIKDFSGRLCGVQNGLAILESRDGITWSIPENSLFMKREVILADGTSVPVVHLERPQLLLDKRGIPLVLMDIKGF